MHSNCPGTAGTYCVCRCVCVCMRAFVCMCVCEMVYSIFVSMFYVCACGKLGEMMEFYMSEHRSRDHHKCRL